MTSFSFAATRNAIAQVITVTLVIALLSGCSATMMQPPAQQGPDLEARVAKLNAREAELAKRARSLKLQESKLDARTDRLEAAEKQLDEREQELAELEKSIQVAEFRAKMEPASSPVATPGILVLGELEQVLLEPPGLAFTARVDTGSEFSVLNASNVTEFERDGKPYVHFSIANPQTGETIQLTRRIRDHVRLNKINGKSSRYPVVRLRVVLGEIDERVQFTLVDRSKSDNPVVIGRNLLRDLAIVDVSKQYTTKPETE